MTIWLPQTDTEGGTHQTERLTNIDMVGGWARQTQRGDALDGKTNFDLAVVGGWVVPRSKIIPLHGPTCKIARFQAGLKFPCWTKVWQK